MSPTPRSRAARKSGRKVAGGRRGGFAGFASARPSRQPFRQAAVQHRGVVVAEQPHQPPAARRRGQALLVVEHARASRCRRRARPSAWRTARRRDHVRQVGVRYRRSRRCRSTARPGICAARNSAWPSLGSFGRYFVASNTTRSGLPSSPASQSVVTSGSMHVPQICGGASVGRRGGKSIHSLRPGRCNATGTTAQSLQCNRRPNPLRHTRSHVIAERSNDIWRRVTAPPRRRPTSGQHPSPGQQSHGGKKSIESCLFPLGCQRSLCSFRDSLDKTISSATGSTRSAAITAIVIGSSSNSGSVSSRRYIAVSFVAGVKSASRRSLLQASGPTCIPGARTMALHLRVPNQSACDRRRCQTSGSRVLHQFALAPASATLP